MKYPSLDVTKKQGEDNKPGLTFWEALMVLDDIATANFEGETCKNAMKLMRALLVIRRTVAKLKENSLVPGGVLSDAVRDLREVLAEEVESEKSL